MDITQPVFKRLAYLGSLHPEVCQQKQAGVRERFDNAVELAEQAFATELQGLTARRAEHRTGPNDSQPKVFRDFTIEALREFFVRLPRLNIRSSADRNELLQQAQQVIEGVEPQTLCDSNRLRQMVARDFEQIQAALGDLLVDTPGRNILRRAGIRAGLGSLVTAATTLELAVGGDGTDRLIYGMRLPLWQFGKLWIRRASHVEPDREAFWRDDMGPIGERCWGRSAAG